MMDATVRLEGPNAVREAQDLRAHLTASLTGGDLVSDVEVNRSAELVIASVGLVLAGTQTAIVVWEWWQSRKSKNGLTVRILLDSGEQVELSGLDREQFESIVDRRLKER